MIDYHAIHKEKKNKIYHITILYTMYMIYILSNSSDILLKVALKHNKPKPDTLFQLENTTRGYLERIRTLLNYYVQLY